MFQYDTITKLEISYDVNKVCQFLYDLLEEHWKAVKRILRYLQGTVNHVFLLTPVNLNVPITITSFCDVDWAFDPDDKRADFGVASY